jgi:hypothetical protein
MYDYLANHTIVSKLNDLIASNTLIAVLCEILNIISELTRLSCYEFEVQNSNVYITELN